MMYTSNPIEIIVKTKDISLIKEVAVKLNEIEQSHLIRTRIEVDLSDMPPSHE